MWDSGSKGVWEQLVDPPKYKSTFQNYMGTTTNLVGQAINTLTTGTSISYNMADAISFTN